MAPSFTPYISFPGNADEAFHYYEEIFGGELEMGHYSDMPTAGFPFTPPPDAVSHAQLHGGLVTLAGGDGIAEPGGTLPPLDSPVYSFLIELATVEAAESVIERLTSTGSQVAMPFAKAPWGDHYGQITDPFGVLWALVVPGERG
jgi:PhnB protein